MIKVIRGNTKKLKFQRKTKDGEVITQKPDKMYFTVKENYYTKEVLFQKKLDESIEYNEEDNYYYITIEPSDTDGLNYDTYVFDIKIITDSEKKTIIRDEFVVEKAVTFAENEV